MLLYILLLKSNSECSGLRVLFIVVSIFYFTSLILVITIIHSLRIQPPLRAPAACHVRNAVSGRSAERWLYSQAK